MPFHLYSQEYLHLITPSIQFSGMTAIAAVCTPEGFVIGADGRQTNKGIVTTDKQQKIFGVESTGIRAAYGFAGCVEFSSLLGICDVVNEAKKVELGLRSEKFRCLSDYADRFANRLYSSICLHASNMSNLSGLPGDEFTSFLMAGHAKGGYEIVSMTFPYEKGNVKKPSVKCVLHDPRAYFTMIGGYSETYEEMRSQGVMNFCSTLEAGASLIQAFIENCADRSDEDGGAIGGHTHIARITETDTSWMRCPKP